MPQLELKITMDEAGVVAVSIPPVAKFICYGLLEVARDAIASQGAQPSERLVQPATLAFPRDLAKGGNGHG